MWNLNNCLDRANVYIVPMLPRVPRLIWLWAWLDTASFAGFAVTWRMSHHGFPQCIQRREVWLMSHPDIPRCIWKRGVAYLGFPRRSVFILLSGVSILMTRCLSESSDVLVGACVKKLRVCTRSCCLFAHVSKVLLQIYDIWAGF